MQDRSIFPTPLAHQHKESTFLSTPRPGKLATTLANFGGMGSGKTITELMTMDKIDWDLGDIDVVVCPNIAIDMWVTLVHAYFGHKVQFVASAKQQIDPTAKVLVMTWAIAPKRVADLRAAGVRIRVLTLDEGHAAKDKDSQRTQATLGASGLAQFAEFVHVLTGTPKPRWNDDLFPFLCRSKPSQLLEKIGGDRLDYERFRLRYCTTQMKKFHERMQPKRTTVGNRNTDELSDMLYKYDPVAVRTELDEAFKDLPPLTILPGRVKLKADASLKALLKAADKMTSKDMDRAVRNDENVPGTEVSMSRLRRLIGEAKVADFTQLLNGRLEDGVSPILVGAWHTDVIAAIQKGIKKQHVVREISGKTSKRQDDETKRLWIAGKVDVIVGQISAMGTALDGLQQTGHYIMVIEEDWSPDIMDQFYARLRRGGQKRHVHADVLRGGTKLEDALVRISGRKASESTKLHGSNNG